MDGDSTTHHSQTSSANAVSSQVQSHFSFKRQTPSSAFSAISPPNTSFLAQSRRLDLSGNWGLQRGPLIGDLVPQVPTLSSSNHELVQRARHEDSRRSRLLLGSKAQHSTQEGNRNEAVRQEDYLNSHTSYSTGRLSTRIESPSLHRSSSPLSSGAPGHESAPPASSIKPLSLRHSSNSVLGQHNRSLQHRFVTNEIPGHQGLPPNVSGEAAYTPHPIVSDIPPGNRHQSQTPRPETFVKNTHSRSASVVSSTMGRLGQDDDISTIMMRGATDLRNTRFEVEEQRREISFLQSQLDTAKAEKEEMSQRLKTVKENAKKGLATSSKSLDEFRASVDILKARSEESFSFAAQVKSSLIDVQSLRTEISETIKSIEPLLDDDGNLYKTCETSRILDELQMECANSQQVADLLRDRLQATGVELIDAKARVSELEGAQVADREALRVSSGSLSSAMQQVNELSERLKKQQGELYDVLTIAADTQAKLSVADEQVLSLKADIITKEAEIELLRAVQQEAIKLRTQLQERDAYISSLEPLKEQLEAAKTRSSEQDVRIRGLEVSVSLKEDSLEDVNTRLSQRESSVQSLTVELQNLQKTVGAYEEREQVYQKEISRGSEDQETLKAHLRNAEASIEDLRKEIELRTEKLHQEKIRSNVLEERFEDQSVTLRITKESLGDIQERLLESEAKFSRDLEVASGKLNCEIAILEEQKSTLQRNNSDLVASLDAEKEAAIALKSEYEEKLQRQDEDHQSKLSYELNRMTRAEEEMEAARATSRISHEQLEATSAEIRDLREKLGAAQQTPPSHREEVDSLRAHIEELETEIKKVTERTKTIETRYRAGDLTKEEKAFINSLIQTTQSVHEQELVAKGNELRRRDNTIAELRSRINLLESTLAKHLKSQAKTQATTGLESRSMIDLAAWVSSSDPNSSPLASGLPAAPKDTHLNEVEPPVVKSTPVPSRRVMPLQSARATPIVASRATKVSPLVPKTPAPALATARPAPTTAKQTPDKPKFSRLARNCSDDIEDFEPHGSRLTTPVNLGKRDQPADSCTPAQAQSIPRNAKRLRTGTRNRPELKQGEGSIPKQNIEGPPVKSRARRKR